MTVEVLVRLSNFSIRYASESAPAISGVSLSLAKGDRLAVIGESGSGKTTMALAIADLLPAGAVTSGQIDWPALGRRPRHGRDIGYVFQDPSGSLDPVMRIGRQIAEVVVAHETIDRDAARDRTVELLRQVELPDPTQIAEAFPHQLSGGQRQRVALALALAGRPPVLVADEATSALDPVVQRKLVELVARLCREYGLTLVFVTHDIALAAGLGTRLAVVYSARLVELGPADLTLSNPGHPYTKALISSHLGLDRPKTGRLFTIDGQPPDPKHVLPGCRFAPRCPKAIPACERSEPPWLGQADDGAACIFPIARHA